MNSELKLIVAHRLPNYAVPTDWQVITTDPTANGFLVDDLGTISRDNNQDVLSEFGTLIQAAKKIQTMPHIKSVRIAQYRKVVTKVLLPNARLNKLGNYVLSTQDFQCHDLTTVTAGHDNGFLLSSIINFNNSGRLFKNILHNYTHNHYTDDLLAFVVDSIRCGELDHYEADFFLNYDRMLIAGIGLGIFPAPVFLKIMKKIENIVNYHYAASWKKRHDAYQSHNMAFCIERVSGFLLLKELSELKIDYKNILGWTTIITNDGTYDPRASPK